MIAYLQKHTTILLIDIRPSLLATKLTRPTYMHWNDYGAFVATLSIMNHIRQDFPTIPAADEKNFTIRTKKGYAGDLVVMVALNQLVWDKISYQIDPPAPLRAKEVQDIPNTDLEGYWDAENLSWEAIHVWSNVINVVPESPTPGPSGMLF